MNPPDGPHNQRPPLADAMRRIEDAFPDAKVEGRRPEPSADAIRAAEALLFAGGEPVTAKALGDKLGPEVDVAAVLMRLTKDYAGRGVELVESRGPVALPVRAGTVQPLRRDQGKRQRSCRRRRWETLAVIAYHQAVTRAELGQFQV